jgi:hypothetical protein
VPSQGNLDDGEFGALLTDEEFARFAAAPQALPMDALSSTAQALYGAALSTPPSRVILSNLSTVTTQGTAQSPGSPGSCEAQSFGTGLGTYTAARNPDGTKKWDAQPLQVQISAAFLYAKAIQEGAAGPCPGGGQALVHLETLVAFGAPSTNDVGYQPTCAYLNAVNVDPASYPNAANLRIGSYKALPRISPDPTQLQAQIAEYRKLISAGHVIAFSGLVALQYGTNTAQYMVNGVFTPPPPAYDSKTGSWTAPFNGFCDKTVRKTCGHGQIIVGYDDTLQAFLVQNSMSPNWPPNATPPTDPLLQGRIWWAYSSFFGSQGAAAIAFSAKSGAPAGLPFNVAVISAGVLPSAFPIGTANSVVRSSANGLNNVVALLEFSDAVKLTAIGILPPGASSYTNVSYNASMSRGYIHFQQSQPWPAGNYGIALSVTFKGQQATYTVMVSVA